MDTQDLEGCATQALVVVYILDLGVEPIQVLVAVRTQGLAVACTLDLEAASTQAPVAGCTLDLEAGCTPGQEVELILDPGEALMRAPPSQGGYRGPWPPCITGILGDQWQKENCPDIN